MNTSEIDQRQSVPLIIAKCEDGYRVCSPVEPATQHVVSGLPENPRCTCPQFLDQQGDPEFACEHILAVLKQPSAADTSRNGAAVPSDSSPAPSLRGENGSGPVMVLKRSVSPDRRIDSLSVEFICPIGKSSPEEVRQRAEKMLTLQTEIANGFLKANGSNGNGNGGSTGNNGGTAEHPQPGQILGVAAMNSRWGRRLFLNVLVNGATLKLFGSEKQLAEALANAGFSQFASHVAEGVALNLPCRVATKPSPDGRYVNIERIYSAAEGR